MVRLFKNEEHEIDYRNFPTYESYLLYLEASAIRQQAEKELDSLGGTYKKRYFQLRDKNLLNSASLKEYQDFNKLIKKIKENPEEVRIVIDSKLPDENATKEVDRILASNSDWEVWRVVTYKKAHELMKNSNCGWCIAGYYHNNDTDTYFNQYLNDKRFILDGGYYFYINKKDKNDSICILRDTNNNIQVWACPDHRMRDEDLPDNLPHVTGINLDAYEYSGSDGYDGYYEDEENDGEGDRSLDDIISDDHSDELDDYIENYYGGYDRDVWIECYNLAKEHHASNCLDYLLSNDNDDVLIDMASEDIWDAFWNDDTNIFNALKYALGDDYIYNELPYQIRFDRPDSDNEKLIELLDDESGITEDFKTDDGDYLPQIIAHFDSIDSRSIGWFKKALSDENINEEDSEGELLLERAIEKGHFKLANILLNGDCEIDFEKYEDKHKDLLKEVIDKCEEDTDAITTLNLYNHKLKEEDKDIEDYISENEKKILLNLAKDGKLKSGEEALKDMVMSEFKEALDHGDRIEKFINPLNKLGLLNKKIIEAILEKRHELSSDAWFILSSIDRLDVTPDDVDFESIPIKVVEKILDSGKFKFDARKNLKSASRSLLDIIGTLLKHDPNKEHYKQFIDECLQHFYYYSSVFDIIRACCNNDLPLSNENFDSILKTLKDNRDDRWVIKQLNDVKDTKLFKVILAKYKEKYGEDLVPKD